MAEAIEATEQPFESPLPTRGGARLKRRAEDVFRGLWASLFYSGRPVGKSVLVCSSGSGEGTSTIACGLAIAGSEPAGVARVALVDFNLRAPNLHRMLRIEQCPGVAEVIADGMPAESIIKPISPSLDVYPAGSVEGRALEILRGERLGAFIRDLAAAYDNVLVDVAPANEFSDAQVLAGVVKDVVLVARTERTPREALAQAKKRLEAGGGRVVGLVLNLRKYPIPQFLYTRV